MTIWITLSIIAALTFALKPIRRWLEHCASQAERQGVLVEEYYRSATKFLQITSGTKDYVEARNMVRNVGNLMLRGTSLIKMLILSQRRPQERDADLKSNDDPLEGISTEGLHAFSRALGAALLVSSYQSLIFGRQYRSVLILLLEKDLKEVKEPKQLVFRYQKAQHDHSGWFARRVAA
jgi:hypothetical protein